MDDLVSFLTAQVHKRQELIARAVEQGKLGEQANGSGTKIAIEMRIRELGESQLDVVTQMIHEIEATRLIMKEHRTTVLEKVPGHPMRGHDYWCETCNRAVGQASANWCRTLRLLAMPYAGEPGYLDTWRP